MNRIELGDRLKEESLQEQINLLYYWFKTQITSATINDKVWLEKEYKLVKETLEDSSISDYVKKEFINDIYIERKLKLDVPYYTQIELHWGNNWEISSEEFDKL